MVQRTTSELDRFVVELAVRGIDENKDPTAQQDFDFELSMRPHILERNVRWDREQHRLLVKVVIEGIDPQLTAKNMAEELLEVAVAVLNEVEGMSVIILNIEQETGHAGRLAGCWVSGN